MPTEAPDPYATFGKARDRFFRTALLLSGLSILAAGASRLPTWQVSAPVGWLVGTVNVGFLPTFGPILIVFGYSYLYLTWLAVVHTWRVLPRRADHAGPLGYEFGISAGHRDAAARLSLLVFRLWVFGVPILAHAILLSTYFDFCAPSANPQEQVRLCTLPRRPKASGLAPVAMRIMLITEKTR